MEEWAVSEFGMGGLLWRNCLGFGEEECQAVILL